MAKSLEKFLIFWLIPFFFLALWYFLPLILPFLVGIILGIAIQSFASYLSFRLKINFYFNVFIIYSLIILIITFVFYLTAQVLIEQLPSLIKKLEPYGIVFKEFNFKNYQLEFLQKLDIIKITSGYLSNILGFISNFFYSLFAITLIFVVSIYVALRKNFLEDIFDFFAQEKAEEYSKIWRKIKRKISFWLIGQLFLGVFIGFTTYIFVGPILKINYATMIALFSGLFELIPIIGPILSLLLALAITILTKPEVVFFVAAFFVILQQVENHLLVPLVMKKAISLHPLLVIFGILIGGQVGGILGIIVILPLLGASVEIINYFRMRGGVIGSTFPSGGKDSGSSPDPAAEK